MRTTTSKACDACRVRKIGCERQDGEERCTGCTKVDIACTFTHVRQKPGPPPGYRRKIGRTSPSTGASRPSPYSRPSAVTEGIRRPSAGDNPSSVGVVPNASPGQLLTQSVADTNSTLETNFALDTHGTHPTPINTSPLDRVIPRPLLDLIVQLYYDYVFWLIPYPHRPSFEADLASRREDEPGQEEWTAMVFGLVSMAIAHLPHHLPLPADELAALRSACFRAVMDFLRRDYETYTADRLYTIYCAAGVAFSMGMTAMSRELNGSNMNLALQRNLDREVTYAGMEPVEGEMCRRMWWLIYSADRSGACCEGARVMLNEDLCAGVALPSTFDDDALERAAHGDDLGDVHDSPLWGFYYCSAMWRVAGKILSRREKDHASPPESTALVVRIAELDEIIAELDELFDDCPAFLALKLDMDNDISSPELPTTGGHPALARALSLSPVKHGIGVQQSNLYVSQQAIRLVATQYRKDLVDLRWRPGTTVLGARTARAAQRLRENELAFRADRDLVLSNLLRVLRALPMELMAVNTFPGLSKIRYVASTLLGDFDDEGVGVSQRSVRALSYLQQYVDYLSRLESMSSLG